jgi:hypothetical protein
MPRLARKPSLWLSLILRLVFVIIATLSALWWIEKRRASFMSILIGVLAIAAVWELIRFALHMHRPPALTIDRYPLVYGGSAELRVTSEAEVMVKLVGECDTTTATDISQHREKKILRTRCYDVELFRGKPPASVQLQLPKSPPADAMSWIILVDSTLRDGSVVTDLYPLHVRDASSRA